MRRPLRQFLRALIGLSADRSLRRGLDGIRVGGLAAAQQHLALGPCLFAATHVSWWDGLVVRHLGGQLGADQRVLVDAKRMEDFAFFASFDCLPLDRQGRMGARATLRAVQAHLDGPQKAVWVFPQGRQMPTSIRPLGLQPGAVWMAKHTGATVMPVALDYRFLEAPQPAAFVEFGPPLTDPSTDDLHDALVRGLQRIDERSSQQLPAHPPDLATRAISWLWNQTAPGGKHG